jgi:hypothetical protein
MSAALTNARFYRLLLRRLALPIFAIILAVVGLLNDNPVRVGAFAVGIVVAILQIVLALRRRRRAARETQQNK